VQSFQQKQMIASGQVGTADGTGKKHISDEQILAAFQTDTARGMPWNVKYVQTYGADLDPVTVFQQPGGFRRGFDGLAAKRRGVVGRPSQQGQISLMQQQLGTGFLDEGTVCPDMIEMTVRIDNGLQYEILLLQQRKNPRAIAAGIDNDRLASPRASQKIAIDP
jgi:hypothetical protein